MTQQTTAPLYRPIQVTGEWLELGQGFAAYVGEKRWNGYQLPEFPFDMAMAILAVTPGLTYDDASDCFTFVDPESPPEDSPQRYAASTIEVDGAHLRVYGIGRGFWCWTDIAAYPEAPDATLIEKTLRTGHSGEYHPTQVSGDWLDRGQAFAAFVDDSRWNGFLCPEFTFDVAMAIQAITPGMTFDAASDAFVFQDPEDAPEAEPQRFAASTIVVNGASHKVYGLGGYCWCWGSGG